MVNLFRPPDRHACPPAAGRPARLLRLAAWAAALPAAARAQTITTTPWSAASIPVDQPAALLALALAMGGLAAWLLRRPAAAHRVRAVASAAALLAVGGLAGWSDAVRAQLQQLQRSFTQPGGETQTIPVQAVGGGTGEFVPVVYTNETGSTLRVGSLGAAAWSACFPAGVPQTLPTSQPLAGTRCDAGGGATLLPGAACWVDVSQLCANAGTAARGSHPTQAVADSAGTSPGGTVADNVLANDTDADGPLSVASYLFEGTSYLAGQGASAAGRGSFTLQAGGAYTFTAATPFVGGPVSVTYTTHTGASAILQISVSAPNTPPVANDDHATVQQNGAVTVAVRANDTDANGHTLTVSSVTQGANGSVMIDAVTGNPLYTPSAGYAGSDTFTYTISDGHGGTATATVNVTVTLAANQAPVAVADSFTTGVSTQRTIPVASVLANDTDADGDTLSVVSVQAASHGTVALSGSDIVFTPVAGYEGPAGFTYTVQDPAGATSTASVSVAVGTATAPSLVVRPALVVNAHGTGGTSTPFPIVTALVDADGSESLSIQVKGVPLGLSFNAGTNLGGGVWQFTPADLPNLVLHLLGSYTTFGTHLTVQVIATESHGGDTASVSSVVTLKAAYTTVDITTTTSGSYTGSTANEYILAGSGNNTINAGDGNNIVNGNGGDDTLSAGSGSDVIFGGAGNDTLYGGSGADVLSGGPGNDTLTGGDGGENFVDVFVWSLGDQGSAGAPAVDTIEKFSTLAAGSNLSGGDVLDLSALLQGAQVGPSNGAGNLANYLHFSVAGGTTTIHISHTGGFDGDSHAVSAAFNNAAETQTIVLSDVNLQSLYSGAMQDRHIITQLLNNNKLIPHR